MRRLRPATLLVLAGLGAAAYFVVSSQGTTTTRTVSANPGTASAWRGLVGTPRPAVAVGQRVIVVLKAPSLASQVAAAGGRASDTDERGFTDAALAAQHQIVSKLTAKGAAVRPDFRYTRLLNGFSAVLDPHSLSIVERSGGVEGVYPIRAAYPAALARVPRSDLLARGTDARPDLSLGSFDGTGVTVALLDTGVDGSTPFLHGHVLDGFDFVSGGGSAAARRSPGAAHALELHGTEMAGLLVGANGPGGLAGVASGATVLPLRVAGWQRDATGGYAVFARTDQILAGLERAVDPNADGDAHDGARVALIPLGEPFAAFPDGPLAKAASGALTLDMLVVTPAGNDGPAGPAFGSLSGPGGAPDALTVGAADLKPAAASEQVVVRAGLRVLLNRPVPLAGAWGSRRRRELQLTAPLRVLDSRGFSSVAGKAALLPATGQPGQIAAAAASAGAAAVLLEGDTLPAGALGVGDGLAIPVLPLPDGVARAARAALGRGEPVSVALGPVRMRPTGWAEAVAPFSSWGFDFGAHLKPELVSPGVTLTTAEPAAGAPSSALVSVSGASAASAVAAGAAAVLLQARPDLDAAELKSLLVGESRSLHGAPPQAQGAGLIDLPAAAGVQIAAEPATVCFGRVDGSDWQATQTVAIQNLSSRQLIVYVAVPKSDADVTVSSRRLVLPADGSVELTVNARATEATTTGALAGKLTLTPLGGEALHLPWAVLVAPAPTALLGGLQLSAKQFAPSVTTPAVLNLRAGVVAGGRIQAVRQLDLRLLDGSGKPVGLLARLRDVLPGRYAFGLTGRDPDGFPLKAGPYTLRVLAWPTTPGPPTTASVSFTVTG